MTNCLHKRGVIILNSRSGSVYMRYNPGEHNLTVANDLQCLLWISAPSGMHVYMEILAERTDCLFSVAAADMNYASVLYCYNQIQENMHTSKRWIMSSDLGVLVVQNYPRRNTSFVFHLRFKPVQPSYELELHCDSSKQGKELTLYLFQSSCWLIQSLKKCPSAIVFKIQG